jgi:hypothetical protein
VAGRCGCGASPWPLRRGRRRQHCLHHPRPPRVPRHSADKPLPAQPPGGSEAQRASVQPPLSTGAVLSLHAPCSLSLCSRRFALISGVRDATPPRPWPPSPPRPWNANAAGADARSPLPAFLRLAFPEASRSAPCLRACPSSVSLYDAAEHECSTNISDSSRLFCTFESTSR